MKIMNDAQIKKAVEARKLRLFARVRVERTDGSKPHRLNRRREPELGPEKRAELARWFRKCGHIVRHVEDFVVAFGDPATWREPISMN